MVISAAALPADIRRADEKTQQTYKAALGFERMLVEQLTQSLAKSATATGGDDSGDGGDGASDAATQQIQSLLPGALADAITQAGGLGLARSLTNGLKTTR